MITTRDACVSWIDKYLKQILQKDKNDFYFFKVSAFSKFSRLTMYYSYYQRGKKTLKYSN